MISIQSKFYFLVGGTHAVSPVHPAAGIISVVVTDSFRSLQHFIRTIWLFLCQTHEIFAIQAGSIDVIDSIIQLDAAASADHIGSLYHGLSISFRRGALPGLNVADPIAARLVHVIFFTDQCIGCSILTLLVDRCLDPICVARSDQTSCIVRNHHLIVILLRICRYQRNILAVDASIIVTPVVLSRRSFLPVGHISVRFFRNNGLPVVLVRLTLAFFTALQAIEDLQRGLLFLQNVTADLRDHIQLLVGVAIAASKTQCYIGHLQTSRRLRQQTSVFDATN